MAIARSTPAQNHVDWPIQFPYVPRYHFQSAETNKINAKQSDALLFRLNLVCSKIEKIFYHIRKNIMSGLLFVVSALQEQAKHPS